jgi:hypothetical protein
VIKLRILNGEIILDYTGGPNVIIRERRRQESQSENEK